MKLLVVAALLLVVVSVALLMLRMPGRSFVSVPPPLTQQETTVRDELRRDVVALAAIGPRTIFLPGTLDRAARVIDDAFRSAGYQPAHQVYECQGVHCTNIEVEVRGGSRAGKIIVVGAHYDSVEITPGADDNASGVAALVALARRFAHHKPERTIRFVAFANEEPPHFLSEAMGSWRYARRARQRREKIVAMLSLESIGYYSDRPRSQLYPMALGLFYPTRGNFIGFAANLRSLRLVRRCVEVFRREARIGSQGAALPELIPGISWSDQWSFWRIGVPAVMVTDTALFRNPNYHGPTDTPDTLDYDRMTRVVEGLAALVADLAK